MLRDRLGSNVRRLELARLHALGDTSARLGEVPTSAVIGRERQCKFGVRTRQCFGGGDSFASGLIYGFLTGESPEWAVNCGAAHGALAMTTPGDTTTVSLADVQRVMKGGGARVAR